jgi:three-Cys-motif partner protein
MDENFFFADKDNLVTPPVGSWAKRKYKVVYEYNELFSSGMKNNWENRIYIDLYSGSGKSKIEKTGQILYSSALLALKVPDKYDKYIFCDKESVNIDSLKTRISKEFPKINAEFIVGDCNEKIEEIVSFIPKPSKSNKVLSFCFIDPFALIVKFETIKRLSSLFTDFLVLLAFGMDGKRNIKYYIKENNRRIDEFLGMSDWRERWITAELKGTNLVKFLADEFTNQMVKLGYKKDAINNFIPFHSDERNLPLYYLAFYSRHPRGYDFWKKVTSRNEDLNLFE